MGISIRAMPMPTKLRSWLLTAGLLWMAIGNGVLLWEARAPMRQGFGDFLSFYSAGVLVRRGQGAEIYDRGAQWKIQQEIAPETKGRPGPLPYIRPPFEALLFSLLARWRYGTALAVWTGLKLALLAAIPLVVIGDWSWNHGAEKNGIPLWAVGFLSLGTFPVFMDLLMGQDAPLLTMLFAIAFWQLARRKDAGTGFILGLALFKFQLVAPFLAMLWIAGRKRVLRGFAVAAAAVTAVSAVVAGWRGWLQYPGYLLALNRAKGVGVVTPEDQINLRGLLTLLAGRSPYPGPIHWVLAPLGLAGIAYAGVLWRKGGERHLPEAYGLGLIVAIATSYYSYDYDLLLLMIPLVALGGRGGDGRADDGITRYCEVAGLLLLLLTPVYWLVKSQLHAEYLMTVALLALGIAWARRLKHAGARAGAPFPDRIPDTIEAHQG